MFKRIRNMHPITGVAVGVVATLVLSGTAIAVTDTKFTYSTTQTGYLMVGPGDLLPENDHDANDYFVDGTHAHSDVGFTCFRAPVHLPQKSKMTSVRTSYSSGASSNVYPSLMRSNPATGAADSLFDHPVYDDSGFRTSVNHAVPANLAVVNNALWTYTYRVCVGISTRFYGARIAYQYYTAGD